MPRGANRIVKPPTARQRANARSFNRAAAPAIASLPTNPTSSWWTGASRERLHELVVQEQPRMAWSRFGRLVGTGVISV